MLIPHNEKTINPAYKSKYNRKRENQVVLLMITNGEKWHYIALKSERTDDGFNRPIKSLSRLFRGITSNHDGDFYCLNCLHSFRTDNALKKHERLCENNDYCSVEMPTKLNKILKYNHGVKSLKTPFVIYADLECLLLKQQSCQNNPNESYTERKAIHEPCGYELSLVSSFDSKQDKRSFYRGKDCIKRFCSDLKELGTKIINYEEKEMIPLTDNENKFYEEQEKCHICQKEFCYDKNEKMKFKLYKKVRDHCHYTGKFRGAAHSICNLNYKVPQEIPVKIHNGSKYDYHFIIKELAEEFKGKFECLGENTEKYISFSVPIKKENNNDKTITYKIKFIDSCRFMPSKLSDLVDNLSEINNKDCKTCTKRKKIRSECEFIGFKNNRLNYRCKECNGISTKSINELIEKFPNTYQFCNGDLNKFALLLRKGAYPYEYMDSWERFNETSLPPKKDFYGELTLEDAIND